MNYSDYRLSLDIHDEDSGQSLNVKRGDNKSRRIYITLRDGSQPYHISEDCYAVFAATKPDGKILYNSCTISDCTIQYEMTGQTTNVAGVTECEIRLYGADNQLITSPRFQLIVGETVYDDSKVINSSDEFTALTDLVSEAVRVIDEGEEILARIENIGGVDGVNIQGISGGAVIPQSENATMIDYDKNVHSVNHRGYSANAPENTIPAYILSKLMGFTYVEADVSFTSDGVAVLLHDATIDRTSNGSGSISGMTYAEVSEYDFGSWKSSAYAGTKIATFDEFIVLCKRIGLHPYIELKDNGNYTTEQIQGLVATVKACGMAGKVTWISFNDTFLSYVKTADPAARLGYLASGNVSATMISKAQALRSGENEVFLDTKYSNLTDSGVQFCIDAGIPLEVWTVNTDSGVLALHPYITGVTSDSVIAGKTLYDAGMVYTWTNAITASETNTDPDPEPDPEPEPEPDPEPVPDGPTLLYNWDFTKSLTDTVSGQTAEISTFTEGLTAPTQDSNGVSLTAAEQYIYLCSVPLRGKTVEVDVANFEFSGTTTAHIRFLMGINRRDISSSTVGYGYLIWKKDFGWTSYLNDASGVKGWSGSVYGELSGNSAEVINYFSGKTVKCVFSDDGFVTLYADGELIGSLDDVCISTAGETEGKYMGHLYIGGVPTSSHDASAGNQCYDVTISAVRIYENP